MPRLRPKTVRRVRLPHYFGSQWEFGAGWRRGPILRKILILSKKRPNISTFRLWQHRACYILTDLRMALWGSLLLEENGYESIVTKPGVANRKQRKWLDAGPVFKELWSCHAAGCRFRFGNDVVGCR